VQDREMVESLGYRIRRLFVGVFVAGSALAGLGGVMWGLYQQNVTPQIGAQVNVLIFIVIIIGGLGSTLGCFIGALLVGLMANYTGFLAPKVALFSNIALMVAVLLWRPAGSVPGHQPLRRHAESHPLPRPAAQPLAGGRCWSSVVGLALAPFLFPGAKALSVAAKIWCSSCWWPASTCCWATPASSASRTPCSSASAPMAWRLPARGWAPGWGAVAVGTAAALAVSLLLSLVIGLFSLRVKAIFFAMITLAVARPSRPWPRS
jgi:ABC-type branched-subunit amino acid transport system permease subunit